MLVVVVGLVVEDGEGAVELFDEEEAHHLVVEGHLGEGYLVVCHVVDAGGEAEGTADDEDKAAGAGVHLLLEVLREPHGGVLFAMLVEEDDAVSTFETFEQEDGFALFDFLGRGALLVFESGDDFEVEVDVVLQSFDVDVDAFLKVGNVGLGNDEELDVHGVWMMMKGARARRRLQCNNMLRPLEMRPLRPWRLSL